MGSIATIFWPRSYSQKLRGLTPRALLASMNNSGIAISPGQRPGFMDQKPSQALKARFIITRQSSRAPNGYPPTLKGEIFEINLWPTLMKQAVGLRRQNNP